MTDKEAIKILLMMWADYEDRISEAETLIQCGNNVDDVVLALESNREAVEALSLAIKAFRDKDALAKELGKITKTVQKLSLKIDGLESEIKESKGMTNKEEFENVR